MERINELTSENIVQQNIERLKEIFPTAFSEGKLVVEELQALVGEYIQKEKEFYQMTWAGKTQAQREANKVSTGTLRPNKADSKDWDTTGNIFIEGDNLEVLKLLQKTYSNKIKMIYIDPPYNTGKDFVYKDNYKDNLNNYLEITAQTDEEGKKLSTNTDSDGRFHSNWLNMMYPRLKLARNLMTDDGVIFISIDDNEQANLKKLCDEIFGEENFVANLIWDTNHSAQAGIFKVYHQYILVYSRNSYLIETPSATNNDLFEAGAMKKQSARHPFKKFTFPKGTRFENSDNFELKDQWGGAEKVKLISGRMICKDKALIEDVVLEAAWTQYNQMTEYFYGDKENLLDSRGQKVVEFYFNSSGKIKIVKQRGVETPQTTRKYSTQGVISKKLAEIFEMENSPFDSPKPIEMVKEFSQWFSDKNSRIIDFFSGSGTTAHAVMALNAEDGGNRKCISVQLPEVTDEKSEAYKSGYKTIAEITKERIRRAGELIKQENKDKEGIDKLDVGFRAFKLDNSNIRAWDTSVEQFEDQLDLFLENNGDSIKSDRTEEDVLFEILLKYGLELTLPIEEKTIANCNVYNIGFGAMYICLADQITVEVAKGIAEWHNESVDEKPSVIFKDAGFANDADKTNTVQTLRQAGIENVKSI